MQSKKAPRDKKLIWDAIPEKWGTVSKTWVSVTLHRAGIINSHREPEHLVWNIISVTGRFFKMIRRCYHPSMSRD
jgi:hypothetical protein